MAINPKSLIPDVKNALGALQVALAVGLPARAQEEVSRAHETLVFVAGALGDPACLEAVMAWAMDGASVGTLEELKAGRVPSAWLERSLAIRRAGEFTHLEARP